MGSTASSRSTLAAYSSAASTPSRVKVGWEGHKRIDRLAVSEFL